MSNVFRKSYDKIELLSFKDACIRYAKAHKKFISEETKKYKARREGKVYVPDKSFWMGTESNYWDGKYMYIALVNRLVDPKTGNYYIQEDGFHDEFKIPAIDEGRYIEFKMNPNPKKRNVKPIFVIKNITTTSIHYNYLCGFEWKSRVDATEFDSIDAAYEHLKELYKQGKHFGGAEIEEL